MAQIRTIDGERHNVKETLEEITKKLNNKSCLFSGILELSMQCSISNFKDGIENQKFIHEPAIFIKNNIMMIY